MKTRFTIALAAFLLTIGAATAYARKLYATFGTPASSATYKSPTYTWAANTNNLMPMFTFANGELADYETLCFTFANISSEASVRVGVYYTDVNGASTWRQMGGAYYSPGTKTVNLAAFASESNIDLAKVTGICFGATAGPQTASLPLSTLWQGRYTWRTATSTLFSTPPSARRQTMRRTTTPPRPTHGLWATAT